ncbi:MAG: sugar ABC transporter permease [Paracholeplasma sp.]|uniref:Carbohydrate ABC transporter-like, permease n=2 Tax=Acholeplasma brassicae TaxID=61635 RepID=U4KR42_9MOLU|nr:MULTISPECIES: sugar ABC transporter permease [Paracholeplasma]MDY3196471.1 sugar ABC transporter permease [Paracholeplasma sp.]CCV65408.1 Carbohydrate ABC transporter-like, permease [Paracholeplasma brassicae]
MQSTSIDITSKKALRKMKIDEIKKHKHLYIMMAPYALLFFTFTVIPVFMSLGISFTYFNLLEPPRFIGLENYMKLLLSDDEFIIAIKNTLILAVITGPVSYLMAFVFAWLINELKPKMRAFMTLIFYAPSISGNAYLMWLIIFSGDVHGYANSFLIRFGFIDNPVLWLKDPDYILLVIIIVQLWLSLGVSFLSFIAGLQGVDKTLFEAGAIDGIRNRWQELWYITLPSMKPQLLFGAVMQITTSLAIAEVSMQLVGFPSVQYAGHTIVTHLIDYGSTRFDLGYASAIATVLFLIMMGANLIVRSFLRKLGD